MYASSAHLAVLALVIDSHRGIEFLNDQITILKPTVASQPWVFRFYTQTPSRPGGSGKAEKKKKKETKNEYNS